MWGHGEEAAMWPQIGGMQLPAKDASEQERRGPGADALAAPRRNQPADYLVLDF